MSKGLFLTGTGTDVGKTYMAGLLVKKLHESGRRAGYFKAAMSGNSRRPDGSLIPGDALAVQRVSGIPQSLESMCPYVYETAVSPHLASRLEGNPVRLDVVERAYAGAAQAYDYVTVEGSGGILCPLRHDGERLFLEDVIHALHLPCLLVADAGLGTINSVVLTAFYMHEKQIPLRGILFNRFCPGDVMEEDNLRMCEELTGVPVLACCREGSLDLDMDAGVLAALYA